MILNMGEGIGSGMDRHDLEIRLSESLPGKMKMRAKAEETLIRPSLHCGRGVSQNCDSTFPALKCAPVRLWSRVSAIIHVLERSRPTLGEAHRDSHELGPRAAELSLRTKRRVFFGAERAPCLPYQRSWRTRNPELLTSFHVDDRSVKDGLSSTGFKPRINSRDPEKKLDRRPMGTGCAVDDSVVARAPKLQTPQFISTRSAQLADIKELGKCMILKGLLEMAKSGSGPGGRWFKSTRPDHSSLWESLDYSG